MPCTAVRVLCTNTQLKRACFSEYFVAKLLASSVRYLAFHLSFRSKGGREVFTGEQFKEGSREGEKKLHEHNRSGKRGRGGDGAVDGGNSFKSILHQFQPDYHPSSPLLRMSPKGGGAWLPGNEKEEEGWREAVRGGCTDLNCPRLPSLIPGMGSRTFAGMIKAKNQNQNRVCWRGRGPFLGQPLAKCSPRLSLQKKPSDWLHP